MDEFSLLIDRVRSGDDGAANEIFRRYAEKVLWLIGKNLSSDLANRMAVSPEDVSQDIFGTVYKRLRRGEFILRDDSDFWQLLSTISLNKVRNVANRALSSKRGGGCASVSLNSQFLEQLAVDNECQISFGICLETLCRHLTERERQVVGCLIAGATQKETAEQLNVSTKTVARDLAAIRETLTRLDQDEL